MNILYNNFILKEKKMNNNFEAGNVVAIDYPGYRHVGIADGCGSVYENSHDRNGRGKVSLKEFAGKNKIKDIINKGRMGNLPSSEIISRAKTLIKDDKKYQVLSNNCEHFIREICDVDIKSPQVQAKFLSATTVALYFHTNNLVVKCGLAGASIALALTKDEKYLVKNTLTLSLIGMFVGLLSKD